MKEEQKKQPGEVTSPKGGIAKPAAKVAAAAAAATTPASPVRQQQQQQRLGLPSYFSPANSSSSCGRLRLSSALATFPGDGPSYPLASSPREGGRGGERSRSSAMHVAFLAATSPHDRLKREGKLQEGQSAPSSPGAAAAAVFSRQRSILGDDDDVVFYSSSNLSSLPQRRPLLASESRIAAALAASAVSAAAAASHEWEARDLCASLPAAPLAALKGGKDPHCLLLRSGGSSSGAKKGAPSHSSPSTPTRQGGTPAGGSGASLGILHPSSPGGDGGGNEGTAAAAGGAPTPKNGSGIRGDTPSSPSTPNEKAGSFWGECD